MITCHKCAEDGVDPPSHAPDNDAAIEAKWVGRLDQKGRIAWQCPDCCDDPWAPRLDLDVIAKVLGLQDRSKATKEKAELMFALMGHEVGGRIAEGGWSVVYEAVLRFQREVDALMDLDHPNIVRLLEHGVLTDRMYLVMEHTGGETLSDLLKDGKPPIGRAFSNAGSPAAEPRDPPSQVSEDDRRRV